MAKPPRQAGPLICLAASGGGHLRQLLQMYDFWCDYRHIVVTEESSLGRSLGQHTTVEFVPHFALGQARIGRTLAMLSGAIRGANKALQIIARHRPDWIITTGAGSQIFIVFWARLFGAKVILIDSLARFHAPSAFAKIARHMAHFTYAQSEDVAIALEAKGFFDPITPLASKPPAKQPLLLATVGATLPFPRLCRLAAEAKASGLITDRVILQHGGDTSPEAQGIEAISSLDAGEMREKLKQARVAICHGGTGSILGALESHCHVIVIPRRADDGEHYDDHQSEIAEAFAARNLVQIAHDADDLARCLFAIKDRKPVAVTSDYSALVSELRSIIGPPEGASALPRHGH